MDRTDFELTVIPKIQDYTTSAYQRASQDFPPFPLQSALPSFSEPRMNFPSQKIGASILSNLTKSDEVPRSAESLDALIDRYERESLSSLLQRFTDETRHGTAQTVETLMQSTWERERAFFLNENIGSLSLGGMGSSSASRIPALNERNHVALLAATPVGTYSAERSISTKLDPFLVQEHWKIIQRFEKLTTSEVIAQLERVASDSLEKNISSSPMMGYASVWNLISKLAVAPPAPCDQARAILSYFCHQFQVTVTNRVRQASLAGQDTTSSYSNDLATQCEAFSRLMTGNSDPWAVGFFCLRCGDAAAALHVLLPVSEPSISRILSAMAQVQGKLSCIWDQGALLPRLDSSDRRVVSSLLDDNGPTGAFSNIYKKAVISLLVANSPWPSSLEVTEGLKTVEDFLMGSLWVAVFQANPVDHLIEIGETILRFGPTYFGDQLLGGWAFALPLLATQQNLYALMWLVESGGSYGLLQATHIGVVMSCSGIPIRNIGRNDSVADALSNLLVAYVKNICFDSELGSLVALDYLVQIPNKVRLYKEVAMLIATTGEIDKLVGTLSGEGMRHGGAISKYCSKDEISIILVEASHRLSVNAFDRPKVGAAVMCLMLAHRYADALSMMNSMLAPPYETNDDRPFWLGQVASFHAHYINNRTNVLDSLEQTGNASLIRTSLLLMDLNQFFDLLSKGNPRSECFSIAQNTQLLPSSAADCQVKQIEYRNLDPLIQDSLPFLLVRVIEILSHEYSILKREIHRDTSGVTRERLYELKDKAKLYTSFASSIGIESSQISRLTQIVSLMI